MPAAVHSTGQYLHKAYDLRTETRETGSLEDHEVQVAIKCTTLCGSDLHYYQHFRNGSILVREPLCLGHEAAGEVVAVGANVNNLVIGDSVALEVGVPCDDCSACKSGRYNICADLRFRSSGSKFPHLQGTLQEFVNHPAKWVHRLPKELNFGIGALLEPLSVAIQAVRRVERHMTALSARGGLIFGAGPVGLLVSTALQACGVRKVCLVDIDKGRLVFAKQNNFASQTHTIGMERGATIDEKMELARSRAEAIANLTWEEGDSLGRLPVVFECTGVEPCLQNSIFATESGGAVVMLGLGVPVHTLPISEATAREIDMLPTWRYSNTYPRAIKIATASTTGQQLEGSKLPDIRMLLTHRYQGLESVDEAFKSAGKTKDDGGKAVIKVAIDF